MCNYPMSLGIPRTIFKDRDPSRGMGHQSSRVSRTAESKGYRSQVGRRSVTPETATEKDSTLRYDPTVFVCPPFTSCEKSLHIRGLEENSVMLL